MKKIAAERNYKLASKLIKMATPTSGIDLLIQDYKNDVVYFKANGHMSPHPIDNFKAVFASSLCEQSMTVDAAYSKAYEWYHALENSESIKPINLEVLAHTKAVLFSIPERYEHGLGGCQAPR